MKVLINQTTLKLRTLACQKRKGHRVREVICNAYNLCPECKEFYKTMDQTNNAIEKWVSDSKSGQ